MSYPCPCCGYLTLGEEPPGSFEICPVCGWEDDEVQFKDPTFRGGANVMSLEQARRSFAAIGAVDEHALARVRKPLEEEQPQA